MHLRKKIAVFIVALGLAVGGIQTLAHHAFSAEFDAERPVHLEGTVIKVEWINPHAWVHLRVTKDDDSTEDWMVNRNSLQIGTVIIIDGYQAKDGTMKANGRDLILQDGTKLFLGSSGTGAPE